MNSKIKEHLKKIPLDIRLKVSVQFALIDLMTEIGVRGNDSWTDEEQDLLNKLTKKSDYITEQILKTLEEWEDDGRPTK